MGDPDAVAAAYRRAEGHFWAAFAMGRHLHRMEVASRATDLVPHAAFANLMHVPRMDAILSSVGEIWPLQPDGWMQSEADWPAHVQWGADRYVELVRHLGSGRSVAAAVIARSQLERWTLNVAHHHGEDSEPAVGEGTRDWITRVWSVYPRVSQDMGQAWAEFSELLHGRGPLAHGQVWERDAGQIGRHVVPVRPETVLTHTRIAELASWTFVQVRGCVATLANEQHHQDWAQLMHNEFSVQDVAVPSMSNELFAWPLDPGLAYSSWAEEHESVARGYRAVVSLAAQQGDVAGIDQRAVYGALVERRTRNIARFRIAWEQERMAVGEDFDPGQLLARLFRYVAIAEAAELVSLWPAEPEERALRFAASALRSAYYLWLEDTDLSLPCLRTLLEQTSMARAWRLKPERAARIYSRSGAAVSPARWIEASGWRRAAALGRALGEFSHVSLRSRLSGARGLLGDLQGADVPEQAATARGNALNAVAYLLALEVAERLQTVDISLAQGFREEVTLLSDDDHRRETEEVLSRSMALQDYDFGLPDFRPDT